MWAYATATLRQAWRSPVAWVLAALAVFTGWFAATAAILAITEVGEQSTPLILSTAHLAGVLLALWLIGRSLDEDRHSGFASAADATAPGTAGRLLGRWAGSSIAGTALSTITGLLIATSSALEQPDTLLLLSTSIMAVTLVAAWALLLGAIWKGGGATLAVFLLWILGHLPWGRAPFLEGLPGRVLASLLPGPRGVSGGACDLGYTSAAVAGLLLLTLALSRPADS